MRKTVWALAVVSAVALGAGVGTAAGDAARQDAGGSDAYGRIYDPKTVETLEGEVVEVGRITFRSRGSAGVHLTLRTAAETVSVHLGPDWYLDKQAVRIGEKDRITVKGSRVTYRGRPTVIAAEVRKGSEVLTLREGGGIPVWSGSGQGK